MFQVNLQLIKDKRLKKGYSLQEMSKLMGFNDKAKYFRRETGEYNFKPEEIPVVSEILDIPLDKIFIERVSKRETLKQ